MLLPIFHDSVYAVGTEGIAPRAGEKEKGLAADVEDAGALLLDFCPVTNFREHVAEVVEKLHRTLRHHRAYVARPTPRIRRASATAATTAQVPSRITNGTNPIRYD